MLRYLSLTALILLTAFPLAAQDRTRTISVSGEAEIRVVPDEAVLRFGIESSGVDLDAVTQQSDAVVTSITEIAERHGVPAERVRTDILQLRPEYDRRRTNDEVITILTSYHATRTVMVTLRDLEVVDNILREAIAAGANRIDGVEFRTTDLREHRDEARLLAIDAAREKAEALAGRLEQSLGAPLTISESGYAPNYGRFNSMTQNVVMNAPMETPGTSETVSPGQISIRARVSVVFELAD